MCKIMMFAGLGANKQTAANRWIGAALPFLKENDKDGVGYAAVTHAGELFGERWVKSSEAFEVRQEFGQADQELARRLGGAVTVSPSYNRFGAVGLDYSAIILHTRYATCVVNLANTHPFVSDDTALIHNGVISNARDLKLKTSTCDSEAILNSYLDNGVDQVPSSIQNTAKELQGYYACAVLARDREGVRVLDIFKDTSANLHVCYVKALDAYVYCTSAEILRKVSKVSRMKISAPREINAGHLIRLDARTGETVSITAFNPNVRSNVLSASFSDTISSRHMWELEEEEDAKSERMINQGIVS